MSYARAYFSLLEVRHRVDPITINIPISARFRVHIGTVSLHSKVQMSSRGIARIPHIANDLPLGDILSYAYERCRLHVIINTKTAATLDFSGVAAFLVTNSLLVQCSIAVLLYFCECRPFHLFPSICDP